MTQHNAIPEHPSFPELRGLRYATEKFINNPSAANYRLWVEAAMAYQDVQTSEDTPPLECQISVHFRAQVLVEQEI